MTKRSATNGRGIFGSLGRSGPSLLLGLLALVIGLGFGRFFTYGNGGGTAFAGSLSPEESTGELGSLHAATAERPQDPVAWQTLGTAYVQQAVATGDPKFFGAAESALDRADELSPDQPATLIARGTLALTVHHFADALRIGDRVLEIAPQSSDALAILVDARVELGRYDEATTTLQKLLDKRPTLAALSRASYLRQLHGDLDGAVEAMTRAEIAGSGAAQDVATINALLGDLSLLRGQFVEADRAYAKALRQAPDLVAAHVGRAKVLEASGKPEEARTSLEETLKKIPHPAAAELLGELFMLDGDTTRAEKNFDLVRSLQQSEVDAGGIIDLEIALFEADHGDIRKALTRARRAYGERHTIFTADALAWSLHRNGKSAEALPYVAEALRLGTIDPRLDYHAEAIFRAVGDVTQAEIHRRRLTDTNGWLSPWDREQLGQLGK